MGLLLICARRHLLDAKDFDILMVVWIIVSLGIPLCVGFVCMDLGMTEGRLRTGTEWLRNG